MVWQRDVPDRVQNSIIVVITSLLALGFLVKPEFLMDGDRPKGFGVGPRHSVFSFAIITFLIAVAAMCAFTVYDVSRA